MVNKRSNSVIDISHHNGARLRFDKAKADGIIGVIQKATQGVTYVDATLQKNKKAILAEGLLFGAAYHFATVRTGDCRRSRSKIPIQVSGRG
jgi:lysozyme